MLTIADLNKKLRTDIRYYDEQFDRVLKLSGCEEYHGTDPITDHKKIEKMIERQAEEQHKQKDPFVGYGFGIVTYFEFLFNLISAYIVICIFATVMMYFYSHFGRNDRRDATFVTKYSLGNLGYVDTSCWI